MRHLGLGPSSQRAAYEPHTAAFTLASILCLILAAACSDPPGQGFLVLNASKTATTGLASLNLQIARVDFFYQPTPQAVGKLGDDAGYGPGLSGIPRLDVQCQGVPTTLSGATLPPPVEIPFVDGVQQIGTFQANAGFIQEIRILLEPTTTTALDGESRPVFFEEDCADLQSGGGGDVGVVRILPTDAKGFEVDVGQTTVVTADWNAARDFTIVRHAATQGGTNGSGQGDKLGWSKLFVHPDLLATSFVESPLQSQFIIPDEYFIGFQPGTSTDVMGQVDSKFQRVVKLTLPDIPAEWIKVLDGGALQDVFNYYSGNSNVSFIEPLVTFHANATPNDPGFSKEWEKTTINAPAAWDVTTGSSSVRVAIIDTGIDLHNPDLLFNLAINQGEIPQCVQDWFSAGNGFLADPSNITFRDLNDPRNKAACSLCNPAIGGVGQAKCTNGGGWTCNYDCNTSGPLITPDDLIHRFVKRGYGWEDGFDGDGNGLTDDLVGWDFTDCGDAGVLPDGGFSLANAGPFKCGNNYPQDLYGHGTMVAGLVGAVGNNAEGLAGTVWSVGLVPYKVLDIRTGSDQAGNPTQTGVGSNVTVFLGARQAAIDAIPIADLTVSASVFNSGTSLPDACMGRFHKKPTPENIAKQDATMWRAANISKTLIVAAVEDCPIDYDKFTMESVDSSGQAVPGQIYQSPASLKLSGFSNILTVSSSDPANVIGQGKGGSFVDIVAPGEGVTVLVSTENNPLGVVFTADCGSELGTACQVIGPPPGPTPQPPAGCTNACTGTSFATPQVAGAAALLLSKSPSLAGNPSAIIAALKGTANASAICSANACGAGGAGLLDVAKLVGP